MVIDPIKESRRDTEKVGRSRREHRVSLLNLRHPDQDSTADDDLLARFTTIVGSSDRIVCEMVRRRYYIV